MPEPPFNDLGWHLDERATLYVPYTRLAEATEVFVTSPLSNPCPTVLVDVSARDWAYQELLEELWRLGKDFILLEHDVVPWPGAVHELLDCPRPWCFFGYQDRVTNLAECSAAMFGLVRFRSVIMEQLSEAWTSRDRSVVQGQPWRGLDTYFFVYATEHGWEPHQHHPSVLNANPKLLGSPYREALPQPSRCSIDADGVFVNEDVYERR